MNYIKKYRLLNNMTIRQLSAITDVATGYISGLENNKVNNPTKAIMTKIADALGRTVIEVFFPSELMEVIKNGQGKSNGIKASTISR